MTALINSEGRVLTHTNACLETTLLQLNSSNTCYTTGEHDSICLINGSDKLLLSYYSYFINRNVFRTIQ